MPRCRYADVSIYRFRRLLIADLMPPLITLRDASTPFARQYACFHVLRRLRRQEYVAEVTEAYRSVI